MKRLDSSKLLIGVLYPLGSETKKLIWLTKVYYYDYSAVIIWWYSSFDVPVSDF